MASVRPVEISESRTNLARLGGWLVGIARRSPLAVYVHLWRQRGLIRDFAVRRVASQYRGSGLGMLWAVLMPLCMVSVYSFVFSVIFQSKWDIATDSKLAFALTMFCGMVVYQLFAEPQGAAPTLMVSHANYVKKVVFPLEILPLANVLATLFHICIGLGIILVGAGLAMDCLSLKIVALPLLLVPIILLSAGISWFLASLGVYLRDSAQVVAVLLQILYFLSPVFYPLSNVPEPFQSIMRLNPLAIVMEDSRRVVFAAQWPQWGQLALVTGACWIIAHLGYAWFMRTRRGFADVL